jgi:hypothetical protein
MKVHNRTVALAVVVTFLCASCRTPPPAPTASQKAKQLPTGTLDQILAPIALYPDALLAQMLMSATEPAKVAELDKFIKSNLTLKGTQLQDAAVKAGFDPSFVALVLFPDVVAMMAQQIAWTTLLGQAFTGDKTLVFASIQKWRMQAKNVGTLKSSPQQKVDTKTTSSGQQVIVIEPANPQIIYVPQYNTEVVYTQPPSTNTVVYTQAPSTSTTVIVHEDNDADVAVAAGLIGFTAGVAIGAMASGPYYYAPYPYYGPHGWYGGAYMYNDAWNDYYDHREDAREDWMDHREDLADERTDRLEDRGEQRTERQENRQENRPEQRTERQENRQENRPEQRNERQQTRQENRPEAQAQPADRQQTRQENRPEAQAQPADRQQTRQENRPEAQAQPADRQQTRQETRSESQGQFSQRASDASTARGDRVGSAEARGYGNGSQNPGVASTPRTSSGGARADAFSGYSSGSSQRAASSRGQASRSSSRGGGGGRRR